MKNKYIIGIIVAILLIGGFFFLNQSGKNQQSSSSNNKSSSDNLIPIDSITHGHGLAVDVADSNRLYIATHHGLLVVINEKDLYQIGNKKDDYMGFSPHPINPKVFFTSGHPSFGGNLGFQKSEDGGYTWEKVSNGINGPVDFHAMTVSAANPDLIFGWYQGSLQRSTDGGKNWEIVSTTTFPVVGLASDPKDENIVYAASPQGLMVSKNEGKDWSSLFDGFVSTIAINPQDSQNLISFSKKLRLAKSNDAGKNWEPVNESFNGETPLHTAFDKQNPEIIYTLTEKNSIYKSVDGGSSWNKIR
jgi:photosystem II stability/assembly factor-like uncharacterized protein